MKPIITKAKFNLPEIVLDKENHKIYFGGKSLPEDATAFYEPVIDWFEDYIKHPNHNTVIEFNLEYFNTSSLKKIIEILGKLKTLAEQGKKVSVEWKYATLDEDMLDTGKAFEEYLKIPFKYISID